MILFLRYVSKEKHGGIRFTSIVFSNLTQFSIRLNLYKNYITIINKHEINNCSQKSLQKYQFRMKDCCSLAHQSAK